MSPATCFVSSPRNRLAVYSQVRDFFLRKEETNGRYPPDPRASLGRLARRAATERHHPVGAGAPDEPLPDLPERDHRFPERAEGGDRRGLQPGLSDSPLADRGTDTSNGAGTARSGYSESSALAIGSGAPCSFGSS